MSAPAVKFPATHTSPTRPSLMSKHESYQALLDSCIEGIENFPVDKRTQNSAWATAQANNATTTTSAFLLNNNSLLRSTTSPPPPLHQNCSTITSPCPALTQPRLFSPSRLVDPDATMNRGPLHGAPAARSNAPAYGRQDARANFAIQPAAGSGTLKLKKAAVKIVGNPASIPVAAAASSSPVSGPVKAKSAEVKQTGAPPHASTILSDAIDPMKRQETPSLASPAAASASGSTKSELPVRSKGEESALDDLFARLNAYGASKLSEDVKPSSPPRPSRSVFSFEDAPSVQAAAADLLKNRHVDTTAAFIGDKGRSATTVPVPQGDKTVQHTTEADKTEIKDIGYAKGMSQVDIEQLYLRKAGDYLDALPSGGSAAVETIKSIFKTMRSSYAPDATLSVDDADKLKARYAFALRNYVNQVYKQSAKPITSDYAKKIIQDADGDMLRVCLRLIEEEYLSVENMDNLLGLCRIISYALPKAEVITSAVTPVATPITPSTADRKPILPANDPLDGLRAWPTQERRQTSPAYRACILKGVSNIKTINQLQALVWGGRLESLALPVAGSDCAVIKFLTPEACDKYFWATENGIEIQGDKKGLVFVEKQPGPSSINDTIRNCTEGDASRCVRALDAEEDWSDAVLKKLAQGKGTTKRELDCIKQGKTSRGRHYVDFRFASIYHALNFKQQLIQEEDWESCTIGYAPDPCETAQGVHYHDGDENATGFFA